MPFHATKCLKLFIFVQSNCRQWLRSHSFYVGVGSCCPHSSHCFMLLGFWTLQENATNLKFCKYIVLSLEKISGLIRYPTNIDVIFIVQSSEFACEWNTVQIAAHNSLKDASSSSFIMRRTRFYRILKSEIFLQKRREIRAGCMTWSLPLAPVINKIVGNSLHEIYQFVTMLVKLAFTPHSLVFFSEKGADIFRLYFWKGIMLCFHRFFQIWYRNFSNKSKNDPCKQYGQCYQLSNSYPNFSTLHLPTLSGAIVDVCTSLMFKFKPNQNLWRPPLLPN